MPLSARCLSPVRRPVALPAGGRTMRGRGALSLVAVLLGVVGVAAVAVTPVSAAEDCPNAEIRAAQGPAVVALPDCMALEMVSPPKKFLQGAQVPSVSLDGGRVVFKSRGGLDDPPQSIELIEGDAYVATRGASGWGVESTLPPAQASGNLTRTWHGSLNIGRSFSPDFSRWLTFAATVVQFDEGVARTFRAGVGGAFSPLSPLLVPVDGALHGPSNIIDASFEGASADHSRLFFKPGDLGMAYLAGDPSPLGASADRNGYVAGSGDGPGLALLARDWTGKVWGGRCGSRLGGVVTTSGVGNGRDQGAVSSDGSRALFTTRPGQTGAGACDGTANRLRIMRRVETGYGPEISQLVSSECDRVAPACDTTDGDDLFQGASVDQTKVFFLSSRQLVDSDLDGAGFGGCSSFVTTGCDLYLYDSTRPAGQRLTQVSAGDETNPTPGSGAGVRDGIAAISGDGSHVYFVANGVLTTDPSPSGTTAIAGQPNLYLYQRDSDHPDGRIAFIGTASAADGGFGEGLWGAKGTFKSDAYPVPVIGRDGQGKDVGGDGHILVFRSAAPFTADDSDGGRRDVFRYDATAHRLVRVSKGAAGGTDNGPVDVSGFFPKADTFGTAFAEIKRWVSEDGNTIVLQTAEGLVAGDDNGLSDDYLWRGGDLYRLPGTSRTVQNINVAILTGSPAPALSHDGSSVAFESYDQLLHADGDTVLDVYMARVGGGFPESVPPVVCVVLADDCQGGGAGWIDGGARTSESGTGNSVAGNRRLLALPALSARARKRASRSGVLAVGVRTSAAGRLSLAVRARVGKRARLVGRASRPATRAGVVRIGVRLSPVVRKRLRSGRAVRVTITASQPGARPRARTVLLPGAGS